MPDRMTAAAPWPTELDDLVSRARGFPDWSFRLEDRTGDDDGQVDGLRLIIAVRGFDAYHPGTRRGVDFHYPVPVVVYDRANWQRWLFDRCGDVLRHELGEALRFAYRTRVEDGIGHREVEYEVRPWAPHHGPGRDPNRNVEVGVDPMEQRIRQSGSRAAGWWMSDGPGGRLHDDDDHDHGCLATNLDHCIPVYLVDDDG